MINRRLSRGPWRAALTTIRGHKVWSVRNGHRDPIAIVYTSKDDAELLARSLNLLGSLKHLLAIVRLHEGELRASEKAKYEAARALIHEVEGN